MQCLEETENELTELLSSVSAKLIAELQKENLRLSKENAKLRLSLTNAKAKLIKNESLTLKFAVMQDVIERMTAVRIHRITLPQERIDEDEDEPKGIRFEISQTMLNANTDERNVIDYSLYLPKGSKYELEFEKYIETEDNESVKSDDDCERSTENNKREAISNKEFSTDVIYVPCLQQRHFKDIEHLRKILPDLFFDMFGIRHNKLSLFYASLQKYLSGETS